MYLGLGLFFCRDGVPACQHILPHWHQPLWGVGPQNGAVSGTQWFSNLGVLPSCLQTTQLLICNEVVMLLRGIPVSHYSVVGRKGSSMKLKGSKFRSNAKTHYFMQSEIDLWDPLLQEDIEPNTV